jgi:hypothetical protein
LPYRRNAEYIWNETTEGENFAEKWNKYPERAAAFFAWHARVVSDLERLATVEGLDELRRLLDGVFGGGPAGRAVDAMTERVTAARTSGRLSVARGGGLLVGTQAASTINRTISKFTITRHI